ncbi:gas vesicle protein [Cytobacillus eiseniae]|uniref:Gas vesicle protein n=1 Tax=Cytobacillus eiseniae TaxID=762947 RepID=A0ABS4REV5_9BACI|nr:YtxH domain-containing protein [Cytobacillus eiseniae]MBP2241441.1 gas vesicle protein [Cytobacillus eiseniae]
MSSQERNQNEQSKSEETINTKDFLIGALIGGIVGATTALFLAPKSGKELRNDINEQAIVLKEKSGQIRETAVAKGSEIAAVAKEKTNAITQTVSKQSTDLVNKVKNLNSTEDHSVPVDESLVEDDLAEDPDVQLKLEETKRAFAETEEKVHQ